MSGNLTNSYSRFLLGYQNPRCAVPGMPGSTGSTGPTGSNGTTGATGTPGTNGLANGQIYYFYTEQLNPPPTYPPQPNVNTYTDYGFIMRSYPGILPVSNPNPIYSPYSGYLAFMNQAGYAINGGSATTPSRLASFKLPLTGKNTIPSGVWTFVNNIYSYSTLTPNVTIPVNLNITISLFSVSTNTKNLIGGDLSRTFAINNPSSLDDTPYTMPVIINFLQVVANPSSDYAVIDIYVEKNYTFSSGQVIEFWSEGNSISQVITTFSPQSGPTGPSGSTGPRGPTGSPGTTGPGGGQGPTGLSMTGPTGSPGANGTGLSLLATVPSSIAYTDSNSKLTTRVLVLDGNGNPGPISNRVLYFNGSSLPAVAAGLEFNETNRTLSVGNAQFTTATFTNFASFPGQSGLITMPINTANIQVLNPFITASSIIMLTPQTSQPSAMIGQVYSVVPNAGTGFTIYGALGNVIIPVIIQWFIVKY